MKTGLDVNGNDVSFTNKISDDIKRVIDNSHSEI